MTALAARYGELVAEIEGERFYTFPTIGALAQADENALRADLWGFRAPRVIEAARFLQNQPDDWLKALREVPRPDATRSLMGLFGVGAKIADCIALFGLWHDDAVPIDTHVRQIAVRLFRPELAARTLTPTVYEELAGLYRRKFGSYAGWAQQYLFMDELAPRTIADAIAA
jgi:N-glycosylase/DNA lyase